MKKIEAIVHNGLFHIDDVLSVALLRYAFPDVEINVTRTRSDAIIKDKTTNVDSDTNVFVLDVGLVPFYENGNVVMIDHHEKDGETYDNGIKMAACGKLFRYLVQKGYINLPDYVYPEILNMIFYPIESQDNGQTVEDIELRPNIMSFISMLNPSWVEDSDGDVEFDKAVEIALLIFKRSIVSIESTPLANQLTYNAIDVANENKVDYIIFDRFCQWQKPVCGHNENCTPDKVINFVIWKGKEANEYFIQAVPVELNSFITRIPFPKEYMGKRDEELDEAAGTVNQAVFCHQSGFLSKWKSLEAALKAADAARKAQK